MRNPGTRRPRRSRVPWSTMLAAAATLVLAALPFLAKYLELAAGVSPFARGLESELVLAERAPVIGGVLRFFCPLCGKEISLPQASTAAPRAFTGELRLDASQLQPSLPPAAKEDR